MMKNYYQKNNYEEFYNDWTDNDCGCVKFENKNKDCCPKDCFNDMPAPKCDEDPGYGTRNIRRCDEEAIEREIDRLFKFILNELCNTEEDLDVIAKAFVRLATLLVEDTCLECSEEQLICCVAKDIQALQILIDKTIRDVKCLKKDVKCC